MDPISRLDDNEVSRRSVMPRSMHRVWSHQSANERVFEPRKCRLNSDEALSRQNSEKIDYSGLCGVCHLTVDLGKGSISFRESIKPLECNRGHLICHQCVQNFSIQSGRTCVLCGSKYRNSSPSNGSLESLTDISHSKTGYENFRCYESDGSRGPSEVIRKEIDQPSATETRLNGLMTSECSRRPIRCPRLDCAVNVAFSALTHHFLFDHPDVPILCVEPRTRTTLIVSFADLPCDSSICLALLLVSNKLSGPVSKLFNGSQIHPKYRDRLPLPVLAARLHITPGEEHEGDVIIAWVAGLDIASVGALCCSIQAVDSLENNGVRSLTYTGPINSLKTAQKPRDVLHSGDCVILYGGLLNNFTTDSTNLYVNVIIH